MKESPRARKMRYRSWAEKHVLPFVVQPSFGDGCSTCPDGFVTRNGYISIVDLCELHDRAYGIGGDDALRRIHDRLLCSGVRRRVGWPPALLIAAALRIFGPLRWNYR